MIRNIDINKPMVAVSFDDGPSKSCTGKILDAFEKCGGVATFFEMAEHLDDAPEEVKRAVSMGCEIGSHTYCHPHLTEMTQKEISDEINRANEKFNEIIGYVPRLLRPPYGGVSDIVKQTCNQYLIGWSVDTIDWRDKDVDIICGRIKNAKTLNGQIVLMHSIHETTRQAVEIIVPWIVEQGYQLVTVSELMKYYYKTELQKGKFYDFSFFE